MAEVLEPLVSTRCGYRLSRLELLNWGTFDSASDATRGQVYRIEPDGQTTLLIGRNGCGKSTIVDALLTLLVRPTVRNYNVAAGAKKRERDERTYIKGAYARRSRDDDNRADVQFLRPDSSHYSVLLACFHNAGSNQFFTIAQVLYLNADGRAEKVYCFDRQERSIAADCSGFANMVKLERQLRDRGFKATRKYTEYYEWFRRATGVQPKAMDMLNQTVAVKDIHRLNDFIRDHMLESTLHDDDINQLLVHYDRLNEAHQSLVKVREQLALLEPIEEHGAAWRKAAERMEAAQRQLDAVDAFFRQKVLDLFIPECESRRDELEQVRLRKIQLAEEIAEVQDECRRLTNDIEQAGGDRLREIPRLIEIERARSVSRRAEHHRYQQALADAGITHRVSEAVGFDSVRERLPELRAELENAAAAVERRKELLVVQRGDVRHQLREVNEELGALLKRKENLPRGLVELRRGMCDELGIPTDDLRFAAELIAVKASEQSWQASIEMVLRGLALSLLVPEQHYRAVSEYVDRTRLRNERGEGQRLVYLKVGRRKTRSAGPVPGNDSLVRKLSWRDRHPLAAWIKAEVEERFDYRCCDTMDDFQQTHGMAMTRQCHVKSGGARHSKDDREHVSDARHFVLGWDNSEKLKRVTEDVERLTDHARGLDQDIQKLDCELQSLRTQLAAIDALLKVVEFSEIDFMSHDRAIAQFEHEMRDLEDDNDTVHVLKTRRSERRAHAEELVRQRDATGIREGELNSELMQAERLVDNAERELEKLQSAGAFDSLAGSFEELEAEFADQPLTVHDFHERMDEFKARRQAEADELRRKLDPLQEAVVRAMGRFLSKFPEVRSDLGPSIRSLDGFARLLEAIRLEDLPRHEQRFKERLDDKVTREIGLLSGALQRERSGIEEKIELLNAALRQVEYRPGTHMRLEGRLVRDREIMDFHEALANCLDDRFGTEFAENEQRFLKIQKLIDRLRQEDRWRSKVIDVRRWFDFAAREFDDHTGEERSYYEDSSGQSGGEKAKLAFTILVAAIAYQYDIDPDREQSDRFHFVVVDEMFSKVDDVYAEYALELFRRFGLQLLIVAPLDAKARVTERHVGNYVLVTKNEDSRSQIHSMTARDFDQHVGGNGVEASRGRQRQSKAGKSSKRKPR